MADSLVGTVIPTGTRCLAAGLRGSRGNPGGMVVGVGATVSQTPPVDPPSGRLWFDDQTFHIWDDGWVPLAVLGLMGPQPPLTWTQHPQPVTFTATGYGDGKFVSVRLNETAISTDGSTWTQQQTVAGGWYRVAYGNGIYIAITNVQTNAAPRLMTSPDALDWTVRLHSTVTIGSLRTVVFANGMFVITGIATTGNQAQRLSGTDGINWTTAHYTGGAGTTNRLYDLAYGNGTFVAVGSSSCTTTDGVNWTPMIMNPGGNETWQGITYGNGLFVAVANFGGDRVMTSPDGLAWTPRSAPTAAWASVAYGDGLFVAVANGAMMTSRNGTTWTLRDEQFAGMTHVAYADGKFIVTATNQVLLCDWP